MKIHFLDVGLEKYGDCILIESNGQHILIDGAHHGDGVNRGLGRPSIPEQLEQLMGAPPFKPDLLVITHVHGDHVGCLPALVASRDLQPLNTLAVDPSLGSGRTISMESRPDSVATEDLIAEALLEEDEIASIEDAERLMDWSPEKAYLAMLQSLNQDTLWLYGVHEIEDLEALFAAFNLKILGPTIEHLEICADFIAEEKAKADARIRDMVLPAGDNRSPRDLAARLLLALASSSGRTADALADRQGQGSAKNDQSIILTVSNENHKVLLAGDMQFERAEVPGLSTHMKALASAVGAAGPYSVVKLTHHTSYNGMGEDILPLFSGSPILVHTGGLKDPGHPEPDILDDFAAQPPPGGFYRTDRNGLISIDLSSAIPEVTTAFGSVNDFTHNPAPPRRRRRQDERLGSSGNLTLAATGGAAWSEAASTQTRSDRDYVEVVTRVPHQATKVTVSIQVEPAAGSLGKTSLFSSQRLPGLPEGQGSGDKKAPHITPSAAVLHVAAGRKLPRLLVLTSSGRLESQIGQAATHLSLASLKAAGLEILDVPVTGPDPEPVISVVQKRLVEGRHEGLLILGGYSVIPSVRVSAIDDELRANAEPENDNYIVWSDDPYVTLDNDGIPDLPVSRIPSLPGQAGLVETCLQAGSPTGTSSFGLRNKARPFADGIYQLISSGVCHPSIPAGPGHYTAAQVAADHIYFMLHGHHQHGEAFTGEDGAGGYPVAISVQEIPEKLGAVVFAGCCYGALLTDAPAMYAKASKFPKERDMDESMALSLLAAGAQAFVGCTGIHYSPSFPNSMGEPLHRLFWTNLKDGQQPAVALFHAKRDYLQGVPHTGRDDATDIALEFKIFTQFTCLGLGW